MESKEVKFYWPIPYKPWDADDDMRQRDMAAEAARRWARVEHPEFSGDVLWINRGRKNLVVTVMLR